MSGQIHGDGAEEGVSGIELTELELKESIKHDYAVASTGIVPMSRRRSQLQFFGLWTSWVTGFAFIFLGFEFFSSGYNLLTTVWVTLVGYALYATYAIFGAYLGSKTGQTHALLTRSVFGRVGSWIVSAFVVVGALGWVGYIAGLLAQIWGGLLGWPILGVTVVVAVVMITNNLFGFTGLTVYARYIVTPIMIFWIAYLVIKGFTTGPDLVHLVPKGGGLPISAGIGTVIGFAMWGNEPDTWRYGKPRFWWPVPTFVWATCWFTLFVLGGWIMAALAHTSSFGKEVLFITHYSLFGAVWLAWVVALVAEVSANDGNYYEAINAAQNLVGGARRWKRTYTCLVIAGLGALSAWIVNYVFVSGWFIVGDFLAITVPCATVIMVVDRFLLHRLANRSRSFDRVPTWGETEWVNVPALIALIVAVGFGAWASALFPWVKSGTYWGIVPVEAWALAAVVYVVGAVVAGRFRNADKLLGISRASIPAVIEQLPDADQTVVVVPEG